MPVFTQEQYDALTAAIATGSKRVKYSDKEVEYRSLSEMLALLGAMAVDLGITATPSNSGRRVADYNSSIYPSQTENCS